jgi:hypothetical protein
MKQSDPHLEEPPADALDTMLVLPTDLSIQALSRQLEHRIHKIYHSAFDHLGKPITTLTGQLFSNRIRHQFNPLLCAITRIIESEVQGCLDVALYLLTEILTFAGRIAEVV